MTADTLQLDSAQLAAWQSNPQYDYDRELVGGSQSLIEWLMSVIGEWLNRLFDDFLGNRTVGYALIATGAVLVMVLLWFLWRRYPRLFLRRDDHAEMDYDVEEDTIYGIDFDEAIRQATARGDYREAVRLLYLQTLKHLSDTSQIDWQPSKTPTQYMRQLDRPAFSALSHEFIRVRYGNFEASEELLQRMQALQHDLLSQDDGQKGGEL